MNNPATCMQTGKHFDVMQKATNPPHLSSQGIKPLRSDIVLREWPCNQDSYHTDDTQCSLKCWGCSYSCSYSCNCSHVQSCDCHQDNCHRQHSSLSWHEWNFVGFHDFTDSTKHNPCNVSATIKDRSPLPKCPFLDPSFLSKGDSSLDRCYHFLRDKNPND